MYTRIVVPVDLAHLEAQAKALATAARLAALFNAAIRYVGVTGAAPSEIAPSPEAFAQKLDAFAAEQAQAHGVTADAKAYVSHDPGANLDALLATAIDEAGADLVVMASHAPSIGDFITGSHGAAVARSVEASVFIVR